MTTDERLDKLEQQLTAAKRRLRWLAVLAGFAVIVFVMAAANNATSKPIIAQGFILVDPAGKKAASLEVSLGSPARSSGLYVPDMHGRIR